jgi:Rieske Fe-S protein
MTSPASQSPQAAPPLPGRRTFFQRLTYGLVAIAAAVVGIPFVGYLLGTWRKRAPWVDLGPVSAFRLNETQLVTFDNPLRMSWAGMVSHTGVYVRKEGESQFTVFSVNCAHLGCPVSWFPQSGLFMCPCHGGVYYANGDRASGPPPRGLYRCVARVRAGRLEIRAPHYPTLHDTLEQA